MSLLVWLAFRSLRPMLLVGGFGLFFLSGNLVLALVGLFVVGVGMALLNTMTWALEADTVVLGLGFPTLVPSDGVVSMTVADVPGVVSKERPAPS